MFRQQRISLFIIVLGVLIAIGTGVKAHLHIAEKPYLRFTSDPKASTSCNIDGYTFTHTRETYSDGVIYTDGWWRRPLDPEVEMTADAHGAGWVSVLFYGNIDSTSHGDAEHPKPAEKLGSWVDLLPLGSGGDHTIRAEFRDNFNYSYKTYSWNASGSIKLVPVYWKWRLGLPFPSGTWEDADDIHHDNGSVSGGGSWLVEKNWTTLRRSSPGNRQSSGSDGSTPPTGSSPGSSTSSNGVVSSGCANNETYDYCDDKGSCSTGSSSGVPGPICGHNYCCCTPGSDSDSGSDQGSNNGNSGNSGDSGSTDTGSSNTGNSGDSGNSEDSGNGNSGDSDTCSACGVERGSSAWIADSLHETVTCSKCDESFTPCTNSSCSYDMYGGWHSSE